MPEKALSFFWYFPLRKRPPAVSSSPPTESRTRLPEFGVHNELSVALLLQFMFTALLGAPRLNMLERHDTDSGIARDGWQKTVNGAISVNGAITSTARDIKRQRREKI